MLSEDSLSDTRVAVKRIAPPPLRDLGSRVNCLLPVLQQLGEILRWASPTHGPLGDVIPPGAKVIIKPNLVLHYNRGPWGIEPLITHPALISTVVEASLLADASEVRVGDAPIQSCDFDALLKTMELDAWAQSRARTDIRFKGVHDFRRTTCEWRNGVRIAAENLKSEDRFVMFDLGTDSLLEPITDDRCSFRVTCYDPRGLCATHSPGRHRYLVAREIMEADVVINLPKLKTHKKAGVTCALKNLVGINGNKEFLPHHRVGGSERGGDCYPGHSSVKQALEYVLDCQNRASGIVGAKPWGVMAEFLQRISHKLGDEIGVEGSWYGNDTIWRTCLDLNRILIYGKADGTLADCSQRRVIHIVDAMIAGHGDGPLSPQPLELGLMLAGGNAAAVDWVSSRLLGYNPSSIPLVHHAFDGLSRPLAHFGAGDVSLYGDLGIGATEDILNGIVGTYRVIHPAGWRHAERSLIDLGAISV